VARDPPRELARERDDLLGRRAHEVEEEEWPLRALVDEDPVGQERVKVDVEVLTLITPWVRRSRSATRSTRTVDERSS